MSNFMKLNARTEERIGHYATRLLRVESHLRRGEKRAAAARLQGLRAEVESFMRELEFPVEMTIIGAQLGLFSGKGSFLRGRLPGAVLGAAAGWLYGQSQTAGHQRFLAEIGQRAALLEHALTSEEQEASSPSEEQPEEQEAQSPPLQA